MNSPVRERLSAALPTAMKARAAAGELEGHWRADAAARLIEEADVLGRVLAGA